MLVTMYLQKSYLTGEYKDVHVLQVQSIVLITRIKV